MKVAFKSASSPIGGDILSSFNSHIEQPDLDVWNLAEEIKQEHKHVLNEESFSSVAKEFDLSNLDFETKNENEQMRAFEYLNSLIYFLQVKLAIPPDISNLTEFKGLSRMVGPPIEAYKYQGYHKLEIIDDEINYAQVYE